MTLDELWDATLGELELELSKANFVTWFDNTFIYEETPEGITIGVPNAFTKAWLEKQYHDSIITGLRRIADHDIRSVTYKVATKQQRPEQQAASTSEESTQQTKTETPAAAPQQPAMNATIPQTNTVTVNMAPADLGLSSTTKSDLNPRYTFSNYVVGKKNELAHAACLAIAQRPGSAYNPLFIYGGVGLGKTHLMQAVGQAVMQKNPSVRVLYVTCENFTNEFIKMVGEGRADEFKDKYRSCDVLMVDDIQFLAGKEGTQEAFFHTFNHLHQGNKQIIMTSDRPPRAIPTLEDRLVSRFEGGMMVDVSLPDLETRIAILRMKCKEKKYDIDPEIMNYIAMNVQNNIRELEGALNKVIAFHELNKEQPTIESVQRLLSSFTKDAPRRGSLTAGDVIEQVVSHFDISVEDLKGSSRKKELVVPRQIAMYLMREEMNASYPTIGQEFGGRDHTTAMHACTKIKKLIEKDDKIKHQVESVRDELYAR